MITRAQHLQALTWFCLLWQKH